MRSRSLTAVLVLALAGCHAARQSTPAPAPEPAPAPPAVAVAPAAPTTPASDALQATLWMQRAAEHDVLVAQTYAVARAQLDRMLADKRLDAMPKEERDARDVSKLPPAIIVDVDETVLDNSPFQVRMVAADADFDQAVWDQWCSEKQAQPLPGALEFAQYAAKRGVTMFYVTNRGLKVKQFTDENLHAVGFPFSAKEPTLFMAGDPEECAAAGTAKSCRRKMIARTHRVVMLVGDQLTDFVDLPDNSYAARDAVAREYTPWFGQRWFMLPNPMYGSWDVAAGVGLPKGSTREQKRMAKRAALDDGR
jgi:acid phosphatase